jgi:hypothetical protein
MYMSWAVDQRSIRGVLGALDGVGLCFIVGYV